LQRENEELNKRSKSLNEKVMSYQKANEKVRKDKDKIEDKYKELKKQMEL